MADLLIAQTPVGVARRRPYGGWQERGTLSRRDRRRRLDDSELIRDREGEARGRHVERL